MFGLKKQYHRLIMKKFSLFIAALALFAMSGCNKQASPADVPDLGTEVSIRPLGLQTRSAVSGTAFPQGYDMLVSAYRNLGSHPGEDTAQDYFEGIQFGYNSDVTGWKSERGPKYYPLDGTLDFLAIAGAGINVASTGIVPSSVTWGQSSNVAKKFVVVLPDNSVKFDDILYGASNAQGLSASGSPMEFKHAMTSVVFLAKCNVAYSSATNSGITVDGITIDGAKYSGTLTVNNPAAGGGSGSLSAAWSSLGDAKTHISARVWNTANLGTNTTEAALSAFNLTSTYTNLSTSKFGDAYVIMPPQDAVPFTVTYTLHNGFAADGTTPLNKQMQFQYTPTGTWDMAKKNVYSLDFGLTEIVIKPTIVDWDAVTTEVDIP